MSSQVPAKDFVNFIDRSLSSNQSLLCILRLYDSENSHAINLQIDHNSHLFRMIDDNLGVCEWPSYPEFQNRLQKYLETFYPEKKEFVLECYNFCPQDPIKK